MDKSSSRHSENISQFSSQRQDHQDFIPEGEDDDLDFSDPLIRDLIQKSTLKGVTYEDLIKQKNDRIKGYHVNTIKLRDILWRNWLKSRGKRHMIDFDDKERSKLKQYFKSLDEDGSGSIGLEELEDPLISLGIAESREDVKKIIDTVDDDDSGQIEFKEFLDIIKNKNSEGSNGSEKDNLIIDFFKNMINGKLGTDGSESVGIPKSLPFSLIISSLRRQKLLDAIQGEGKKKEDGEKVMKAYGKLVAIRKAQKDKSISNRSGK